MKKTNQQYTSAATSINSKKVPVGFKHLPNNLKGNSKFSTNFRRHRNLDYGGGKYDTLTRALWEEKGIDNFIYDPYNRSDRHNDNTIFIMEKFGADSATLSNVMNVIKEPEVREEILQNIRNLSKPGAMVYITCYEGDRSGKGKLTRAGYQTNMRTKDYISEVEKYFSVVKVTGNCIIAKKGESKHV